MTLGSQDLPDPLAVHPLDRPPEATVQVPGSKSLTNRALVAAGLARGASTLTGALRADDTEAMLGCLAALGVSTAVDWGPQGRLGRIDVHGSGGRVAGGGPSLDARLSGTTSRFVLPVAALADGPVRVDGAAPLRARPMGPTFDALRRLGVRVAEHGAAGHLPVTVEGPLTGGELTVAGDASSQFLSGLLLAAPATAEGMVLGVDGPLVSRPYVDMTVAVMRAFGAEVHQPDDRTWVVAPGAYGATSYAVEPDASAASYLFAAAAISGGRITVEGLGDRSVQGDVAFVDVLASMGAEVERTAERTTVTGTGILRGIDVDMADLSDTAQTLAAVAVFADGPTRMTGIGFIRAKETDRIAHPAAELRRCGIRVDEEPDGLVVHPGDPRSATIETYHDHRMAMAFALLGLRAPGIRIAAPGVVAKTFPGYWDALASLGARLGGE